MSPDHALSAHQESVEADVNVLNARRYHLEGSLLAIQNAIETRLRDDGLNYHLVKGRVKTADSVRVKLGKINSDGDPKYANGLAGLDDVLGVRVITYIQPDVKNVVAALTGQFHVLENTDKTAQLMDQGMLGYAAHHLILQVSPDRTPSGCANCVGEKFEVQVKTVLQHAWAEFEHDIRYKTAGKVPPAINRAFTLASGLIELADNEFIKIHEAVAKVDTVPALESDAFEGVALNSDSLGDLLAAELPDHPRSRKEQYDWLVDLLGAMEISTVDDAVQLFTGADWTYVTERMDYKFPAGHVRVADDFLIHTFGADYISKTESLGDDPGRAAKLKYRWKKLVA